MADRPDTRRHPKLASRHPGETEQAAARPIAPVKSRPRAVGVLCWSRTLADFSAPDRRRHHSPIRKSLTNVRGDQISFAGYTGQAVSAECFDQLPF
jgi:hypothetical protein